MQRSDLARAVANRLNLSEDVVSAVVTALFEEIEQALARSESIIIRGFGTFRSARTPGSKRPNPGTGVDTLFPSMRTVRWKPATVLRARLNRCLAVGDEKP